MFVRQASSPWTNASTARNMFQRLREQGYFVKSGQQVSGPFVESRLRAMLAADQIRGADLVRQGESGNWVRADDFVPPQAPPSDASEVYRCDCGAEVSMSQATGVFFCSKCGRQNSLPTPQSQAMPSVIPASPGPQVVINTGSQHVTIEQTSKRIKAWILISAVVAIMGFVALFSLVGNGVEAMWPYTAAQVVFWLGFFSAISAHIWRWWNHG